MRKSFIQRARELQAELEEWDNRIYKLRYVLPQQRAWLELPARQRRLIRQQTIAMDRYSQVLSQRIEDYTSRSTEKL